MGYLFLFHFKSVRAVCCTHQEKPFMNFERKDQLKKLLISSPRQLYEKLESEIKKKSKKSDELIQLMSQYQRLEQDRRMNLIPNSEYDIKISKLTFASISFLDTLEKDDFQSDLFDNDKSRYYLDEEMLPDENYFKMIAYESAVYKKLKGGGDGKELGEFLESFFQTFQNRMKDYCELFGTEYYFKKYKELNIIKCVSDNQTQFIVLKMASSISKHLLVLLYDKFDMFSDEPIKKKVNRYTKKYYYGLNSKHEIAWKFKEDKYITNQELADLIIKNIQGIYYRLIMKEFEKSEKKPAEKTGKLISQEDEM